MFKTARQHIVLIGLSTVLAGFSLASIIFFTDPYASGMVTHAFFYLSLYLVFLGIFTILGLLVRELLLKGIYIVNLSTSFRQALLVSFFICTSLFLRSQDLLYWWVTLSLILFLTALEIFLSLKT